MQKVKVTTLWNFSLLPHLFIIYSLDACAKNLGFQNNVYGRWSLQSWFLSLKRFDLLHETHANFSFNCIQHSDEAVQEKLLLQYFPFQYSRTLWTVSFNWILGPENMFGVFALPPSFRSEKENVYMHDGILWIATYNLNIDTYHCFYTHTCTHVNVMITALCG